MGERDLMAESRIHIGDLRPGDVALIQKVTEEAAEKAVAKALLAMGLDLTQPIKAQRDFTFLRQITHDDDFQADLDWVRRARKRSEGALGKVIATAIALGALGAVQAAWTGIQTLAGKH